MADERAGALARRASVLLVDDKPENLVALAAVLEPLGHDLMQAQSGQEALRLLLKQSFAVILLDVQMPGIDGFETARLIKERERTRDVPIIFVTALSKDADHIFRGYSEGAVDYVVKPYDPEVLRSKVAVFASLYEKTAALEESEQRFRSAFANAPSGMALLSIEGGMLQVNRALSEMLGRKQAQLIGATWDSLLEAGEREVAARELGDLASNGRGLLRSSCHTHHSDGRRLTLSVSASPAPGDGPARVILQVEDQTEREQAQREREARAEAEALNEIARGLQRVSDVGLSHLTLAELLPELLGRVVEALGASAASVLLVDPDNGDLVLECAVGDSVPAPGLRVDTTHASLAARAALERRPLTLEAGDLGGDGEPLVGEGARSLIAAPLVSGGDLDGVLCATAPNADYFDSDDLSLLSLVTDRAALAISNARMYEREHDIVGTLQRSLLPATLPQLPGMAVEGRYLSGGAGTPVGGDWYDAIVLDGGRVGLAMGDVVGHGLDAAALMSELRNALRAYALAFASPAEVLRRLDQLLQAGGEGRMATLVYAVVEPDWTNLRLASAGHPPPLIAAADGTKTFIWEGRSTPLGAERGATYEEVSATLPTGATLLLYTDGLVEVRGESLDAGLARLAAATEAADEPRDLCDRLTGAMLGEKISDDVAMLAFRNRPLIAERLRLTPPSDPRTLVNVRRTLGRWLELAGATPEETGAIELSCHEACANAVEHAYGFGSGNFVLEATLENRVIEIMIHDEGSWREPVAGDRGRGIGIMHSEMDEVSVSGGTEGTTVRLRKRLGSEPAVVAEPAAESARTSR